MNADKWTEIKKHIVELVKEDLIDQTDRKDAIVEDGEEGGEAHEGSVKAEAVKVEPVTREGDEGEVGDAAEAAGGSA